MLLSINNFIERYKLEDFIVVADSGMLNNDNLSELEQQGYKYIIDARIKNTSADVRDWILSLTKQDAVLHSRNIDDTTNNIYSQTLFLTNRHKLLKPLFENQFWGAAK